MSQQKRMSEPPSIKSPSGILAVIGVMAILLGGDLSLTTKLNLLTGHTTNPDLSSGLPILMCGLILFALAVLYSKRHRTHT